MFRRVLIANRGEIAVRIIRTLREMGITSIAAFSDADRDALFVQEADEAYRLGASHPAESYLNVSAILGVARQAKIDAIHPGYGFLAENADFAQAVVAAGVCFIGPSVEALRLLGDKLRARSAVHERGVPVVPGTAGPVQSVDAALEFARGVGYPVAVKPAGGGGGRGIRVVHQPTQMAEALERASREAEAYFTQANVYLERYFEDPRHVEIQVLGDRHDHVVHLGERDCSVQRRYQKLLEESPSPAVDRALRERMGEAAVQAARAAAYDSAGTVEFLLTAPDEFYFLEMNTRIQVEHPVTEQVTGVDLIREMVLAAAGEPITVQECVRDLHGHAIEVRVNAEDPRRGFQPTPGAIRRYREPGGIGVRIDSGVYQGYTIPQEYDSLIAKLIAWAPGRETARRRALRALGEFQLAGPASTIEFARAVLQHQVFIEGKVTTAFVARHLSELEASMSVPDDVFVGEASRPTRGEERLYEVEVNRKLFRVRVAELQPARDHRRRRRASAGSATTGAASVLTSPMHGVIVAIKQQPGDTVFIGETLFIVEAMKMENEIAAHRTGTLTSIYVQVGETVDAGQRLATVD